MRGLGATAHNPGKGHYRWRRARRRNRRNPRRNGGRPGAGAAIGRGIGRWGLIGNELQNREVAEHHLNTVLSQGSQIEQQRRQIEAPDTELFETCHFSGEACLQPDSAA
jgi:hypothetical protein